MADEGPLAPEWRRFVADARTATLTTLAADGSPAAVPICFVLLGDALYSPLDEKPKRSADPRTLARVRHLIADPRASVLVHCWDEDWTRLAFIDLRVTGALLEPGSDEHATAVSALREKYRQYRTHRLDERPMLRFTIVATTGRWSADTRGTPRTS
jgi:PPOX class probable F420-dependent enzyme